MDKVKTNKNKLLPCPFCGGEAVIRYDFGRLYIRPIHKRGFCNSIDTWLIAEKPLRVQIRLWNRRVGNA